MPDPVKTEIPAAITDGPQAQAMQPVDDAEAVKKMTHDSDSDDMVGSTT